ncbi:MAG: flagellar motor switch protein FliN [Gammaproteobacteria bacterium]
MNQDCNPLSVDASDADAPDAAFDAFSASADMESPVADPVQDAINLEHVMDVPVTVSIEMGRTQVSIRQLLNLKQGSVVELDRYAGEPVDVLVNGTLVAHGEVVVVNEKFGIRLTDVIGPSERVKKLA